MYKYFKKKCKMMNIVRRVRNEYSIIERIRDYLLKDEKEKGDYLMKDRIE